jgi:ribosomal protein S12 methylthiotransferase accessory factor
VLCILQGPGKPWSIASASCGVDPAAACVKALDESFLVRTAQHRYGQTAPVPSFDSFDWVTDLEDHANLYACWEDPRALDFLLKDPPRLAWEAFLEQPWWPRPDSLADLEARARSLGRQGLDVLWGELTSDDTRRFGRCVKVVVPQMVPLSTSQRIRWLATPRLLAARREGGDVNPFPHPFP